MLCVCARFDNASPVQDDNRSIAHTTGASSEDAHTVEAEDCGSDLPVQGPLPYEPDDAPWKKPPGSKKRDSSIRKL